jgi:CheY-like chemotaxis protein
VADRVLLVDDEPRILDGIRRTLHGLYHLETASSGAAGLALIAAAPAPYAVVVSDMMMPGMNGAEFLAKAHEASPDTVQMILSGQAELSSTIAAVNDGNLFRFLTKPCEGADLMRAMTAAIGQFQLINSERELLEHTLNGSVEVLTELMSTSNPTAFNRTERVKSLVNGVLEVVPVADVWELRIAAMLGQVGLMAVPVEVLNQIRSEADTSPEAMEVYRSHPALASDLIRRIPRLAQVAEWVAEQPVTMREATRPPEGRPAPVKANVPPPAITGHDVYAAVTAFSVGVDAGLSPGRVLGDLVACGRYRRDLLDTVMLANTHTVVRRPHSVKGEQLIVGMQVNQDVVTLTGLTLIRQGEILTDSMAIRLRHFAAGVGVVEPIDVLA